MDIEKFASELKGYVINGNYEFVGCSRYTATILLNKKYLIEIWTGNEPSKNICIYNGVINPEYVIDKSIFEFDTDEERLIIYNKLLPYIKEYQIKELAKEQENIKKQIEYVSTK